MKTKLSLKPITMDELKKVIKNIPTNKAVMDQILTNILKQQILPTPHQRIVLIMLMVVLRVVIP